MVENRSMKNWPGSPRVDVHDDVIRIIVPEPDSHFRLRACPECNGDNVAYVQYTLGNLEPWRVRCFDCGHTVDRRAAGRHEAQGHWNRERSAG